MREVAGDLWEHRADVIIVPTNWAIRRDGTAVMGAGVAKQAKQRYPKVERYVGQHIWRFADQPHPFLVDAWEGKAPLVAFPTKRHWSQPSSPDLIRAGAEELPRLLGGWIGWPTFTLPRLGCGLGGLSWEDCVRPLLAQYLDDRFVVVTPATSSAGAEGGGGEEGQ